MSNKLIVGILSIAVLFSAACKRETMVGAQRGFATKDFKVETAFAVSKASVNMQTYNKSKPAGPLFFSAIFNEDVSWTIHISSDDSGAQMDISGKGKVIDVNNGWWQGESNGYRFFSKFDTCIASLNISGIDTAIDSEKIIITNVIAYHKRVVDGVRYLLVDDFDSELKLGVPQDMKPGLTGVSTDMADMGTPLVYAYGDQRVQGKNSLHMEGNDYNKNGWLASINHANLVEMINPTDTNGSVIATSPDDFYVNLYIRGTGKVNSSVEIKLYELDNAISKKNLVDKVVANPLVYNVAAQKVNDGWIYDIIIDWEGWKLVSVPYSKFRVANDLDFGGAGNHLKEPWKITGVALSLLSYPTPGFDVSADVDFVVISEGGPFQPKY